MTLRFMTIAATLALAGSTTSADGGGQLAKLIASDGVSGGGFGKSVAMSGIIGVVGSSTDNDNGPGSGSAYTFEMVSGLEIVKLLPSDGLAGGRFGGAVAISGTIAAIGSDGANDNGFESGAVYVFDALIGTQLAKLLPSDGAIADQFGIAVAMSGATIVVGASVGKVYVFDALSGMQLHKLSPANGSTNTSFGVSVAIDGAIVIVGATTEDGQTTSSGAAYVFDAVTGSQSLKMFAIDGQLSDLFGSAVSIDGTIVAVAAQGDSDNGIGSGSAYVFDGITGNQLAKLLPRDGETGQAFGISIDVEGIRVLVGAYHDSFLARKAGAAYLFDWTVSGQLAKLLPLESGSFLSIRFGRSVALEGSLVLIGAPCGVDDASGIATGASYVFDANSMSSQAVAVVRNGSGSNALILSRITDPILGQDWVTDLDCSGHTPAFATIEVYEQPSSGFFLPGGELLIDVSSPLATRALLVHFGGVVQFSIAVPNDLALCGFTASAQGVVLGAPGYELSNALDLVAGF